MSTAKNRIQIYLYFYITSSHRTLIKTKTLFAERDSLLGTLKHSTKVQYLFENKTKRFHSEY